MVAYHLEDGLLRVEVRDAADGMPSTGASAQENDIEAEGGRGLRILAALADDWGVTRRVIGKSVWAELDVSEKEDGPSSRPLPTRDGGTT